MIKSEKKENQTERINQRDFIISGIISIVITTIIALPIIVKCYHFVDDLSVIADSSMFSDTSYEKMKVLDKGIVVPDNNRTALNMKQHSLKIRYENNDYWVGIYNDNTDVYNSIVVGDTVEFIVSTYKEENKKSSERIDYGMSKETENKFVENIHSQNQIKEGAE